MEINEKDFYGLKRDIDMAHGKIDNHDLICAERYRNISTSINSLETLLSNTTKAIFGRFWKIAMAVILGLIMALSSTIGFILYTQ